MTLTALVLDQSGRPHPCRDSLEARIFADPDGRVVAGTRDRSGELVVATVS